ncbi:hypothetical protein ACFFIX_03500 [Metabacillus herbersteinensis]|uniref:Sin domain-containing protein n=1 Tax=Metabacillus herbersteinensis TaxID=283816 RepID=A0ABV6GC61_9BACI
MKEKLLWSSPSWIGECIWWLIILAERMNIDSSEALEKFLSETEKKLDLSL